MMRKMQKLENKTSSPSGRATVYTAFIDQRDVADGNAGKNVLLIADAYRKDVIPRFCTLEYITLHCLGVVGK